MPGHEQQPSRGVQLTPAGALSTVRAVRGSCGRSEVFARRPLLSSLAGRVTAGRYQRLAQHGSGICSLGGATHGTRRSQSWPQFGDIC